MFLNSTTRKLFYTVAVLIASTFITIQINAQTITGKVSSENGPVENALILAGSRNTSTDVNGSYSLSVTPGTITVEASLAGYRPQKKTITVEAGQTVTVDFVLESAGNLNEVVVVGSRNPGRSSTESPVPVDVIPLKQIANQVGQLDVNQLLTYLAPSFNSVRQSLGDATDHIDPAQLRGLGPDQVLVLVNGKRYHQTSLLNVNGTVNKGTTGTDLNSIPASSIERIEILRDGASAQYGSDAIAGVINIVLKKTTGLSVNASYGGNVTSYDKNYGWNQLHPDDQLPGSVSRTDGQNFQVAANYGIPLKKGYLVLSAEYLKRNASNRTGLYTGQIWPGVNGVDRTDSIN
ncbi:MAG TPA: TonB-dependent receptor plug domain-containing protein, partial [Niabella sp.]